MLETIPLLHYRFEFAIGGQFHLLQFDEGSFVLVELPNEGDAFQLKVLFQSGFVILQLDASSCQALLDPRYLFVLVAQLRSES